MTYKKDFFHKYHIHPSKRLGQNFLTDKSVLKKIIAAAELKPDDIVLEVGPGLGALTLELAKHVQKVIAIEKDKRFIDALKNILEQQRIKNVELIEDDIRKFLISFNCEAITRNKMTGSNFQFLNKFQNYKLVANIPYYLTSPLIRKFLESNAPPELMVLMIQKEVAQRICSKPPKMTLLSVAVQFYAEPKIISSVSKKSFWPQPKVDSAIIRIFPFRCHPVCLQKTSFPFISGSPGFKKILKQVQNDKMLVEKFFKVVRSGFSQPRKQIINNLSKGLNFNRKKTTEILKKTGIKPTQRPGELPVDKWVDLAWNISGKKDIIE